MPLVDIDVLCEPLIGYRYFPLKLRIHRFFQKLKLMSDEGVVRAVLEKMTDNLLASDWIERSFVTPDSSTEKLFKAVARVVAKKRACMDALGVAGLKQV